MVDKRVGFRYRRIVLDVRRRWNIPDDNPSHVVKGLGSMQSRLRI